MSTDKTYQKEKSQSFNKCTDKPTRQNHAQKIWPDSYKRSTLSCPTLMPLTSQLFPQHIHSIASSFMISFH